MKEKKQKNFTYSGSFGERLCKLRKDKKLSQKDLAEKLGYKQSASVSYIENNKTPPDIAALAKIAEVLNADLHWLITGQPSPSKQEYDLRIVELLARVAKQFALSVAQRLEDRERYKEQLADAKIRLSGAEKTKSEVGALDAKHFLQDLEASIQQCDRDLAAILQDMPWIKQIIETIAKTSLKDRNNRDL